MWLTIDQSREVTCMFNSSTKLQCHWKRIKLVRRNWEKNYTALLLITIGIIFCWQRLECQSVLKAKVPAPQRSRRLQRHEPWGQLVMALTYSTQEEVKGKAVHPVASSAGSKLLWWWRRCWRLSSNMTLCRQDPIRMMAPLYQGRLANLRLRLQGHKTSRTHIF